MSISKLAWDDFRLIKAIADAGGLTGAAAALGVNHSTVFRRLGQIEEQLGHALFERRKTGYVATSAGEEMEASLGEGNTKDITSQAWRTALDPAGDWIGKVLRAADRRLYEAKHRGRNLSILDRDISEAA